MVIIGTYYGNRGPGTVSERRRLRIPQPPQRSVQGVLADRPAAAAQAWKDELPVAGERVQRAQDRDRLGAEGNDVVSARLHAPPRNRPGRAVQVELCPLGQAQLPRAHEDERQQLQRCTGDWLARVAIDGPQRGAAQGDGRVLLGLHLVVVARRPDRLALGQELLGDGHEGFGRGDLVRFPLGQRIDAVSERPARPVALLAGTGEADVRVGSEGNGLVLATEAVVEAPELAAGALPADRGRARRRA